MLKNLFRGEDRPQAHKEYLQAYVHTAVDPAGETVFPLPAGAGAAVAPGDPVLAGQRLCAESAPKAQWVHSSCSGTVKAVERRPTARGERLCVVVDNDRKFRTLQGPGIKTDWQELGRSELLDQVLCSGALGVNSRTYPTAARLGELGPGDVSRVVVDAADWEPYVSSDTDLLRTRGFGVAEGLRILLRLFPGAQGAILIGEDNASALNAMKETVSGAAGLAIVKLPAGMAPGNEALIRRRLAGKNETGACLVVSAAAAWAVYEGVCRGTPAIRRLVTVAGTAVKNPGNYLVRTGAAASELLSAAGGVKPGAVVRRAVMGGSLTGEGLTSPDVPLEKDAGAVLFFAEDEPEEDYGECIRCGMCARVCPAGLLPMLLAKAAEECDLGRYEKELHGKECVRCWACAEICPARRPLARMLGYAGSLVGAGGQ